MGENIFWVLQTQIKEGELENLKTLMNEMIDSTKANEPGAINYEWYISDDEKYCHLYERYKDSSALMTHLSLFGKNFAKRFMSCLEPKRMTVYGNPDEEARQALNKMSANFMSPLGGFSV